MKTFFTLLFLVEGLLGVYAQTRQSVELEVTQVKEFVIYEDEKFYASFPSVIKTQQGEYILAFRRTPNRRMFGETRSSHVDPNSYLVPLRSTDGERWTTTPELLYAHAFGGSQAPCLL